MIDKIKEEENWYKKCKLILEFHEDKCSQQSLKRNSKWTVRDTADALGMSAGYVSESLKLAQANQIFIGISRSRALQFLKHYK